MVPSADVMKELNEAAQELTTAGDDQSDRKPQKRKKQLKQSQQQAAAGAVSASAAGDAKQSHGKRKRALASADADQSPVAAVLADDDDDVAALKAQLRALEQENRLLKSKRQKTALADLHDAAAPQTQNKSSKADKGSVKSQNKKAKTKTKAAHTNTASATDADGSVGPQAADVPEATPVDMSQWANIGLHPLIEAALARQGFSQPTPIQEAAIPAAMRDRRDVIGAAQTGSGKTLAFGIPVLQLLLQEQEQLQQQNQHSCVDAHADVGAVAAGQSAADGGGSSMTGRAGRTKGPLRALILAPTRELALQVCTHLQTLGKPCGVLVVPIVGGIAHVKQERLLSKRPQVVVATPGRLWDLMRQGHQHLTDLSSLSFLVIDEADRMVQQVGKQIDGCSSVVAFMCLRVIRLCKVGAVMIQLRYGW